MRLISSLARLLNRRLKVTTMTRIYTVKVPQGISSTRAQLPDGTWVTLDHGITLEKFAGGFALVRDVSDVRSAIPCRQSLILEGPTGEILCEWRPGKTLRAFELDDSAPEGMYSIRSGDAPIIRVRHFPHQRRGQWRAEARDLEIWA